MKIKNDYLYTAFRSLVGLGFMLHGGQKLFAWFGGIGGKGAVELMSLMGLAGVIEFTGGLLILLGLFTSVAALFSSFVMIGAWVKVHFPKGINPLTNDGELAMIYFAAFLILIYFGSGRFSLERLIFKKEFFH